MKGFEEVLNGLSIYNLKNIITDSRNTYPSRFETGNDSDLACLFEFSNFAKNFADSIRIAILGNFHELRLSMEQASESEMLDIEPCEPAKRYRTPQGKAWSFDREWKCAALFDDARTAADFVVEHDIKNRMPATLGISSE